GQHVIDFFVLVDTRQVHHGARGTKVALDRAPIAAEARAIDFTQRGDLHALQFLVGQIVNHAHETNAGDANSYHSTYTLQIEICVTRPRARRAVSSSCTSERAPSARNT